MKIIPKELEAPKRLNYGSFSQVSQKRDVGKKYAEQVTADMGCRCPHLDAYFPKFLDSGSLGLFQEGKPQPNRYAKRLKRLTISDLHLASILPPRSEVNVPSKPLKSPRMYTFGEEEKKTDLIMSNGGESFTPLFPGTFVDQVMKERKFEMQMCKEIPDNAVSTKNISINSKINVTQKVVTKESGVKPQAQDPPTTSSASTATPLNKLSTTSASTKGGTDASAQNESLYQNEIDFEKKTKLVRNNLLTAQRKTCLTPSGATLKSTDKSDVSMSPIFAANSKKRQKEQEVSPEEWMKAQQQRDDDIEVAEARVETWLETIRQNRLTYWKNKQTPLNPIAPTCIKCTKKAKRSKGKTCNYVPNGDALMQCLDCSIVLCGSDWLTSDKKSKRHMQQHFLLTNHNFAITCGEKGEIYCMKCGDFVYCQVFDSEKERVEIGSVVPWFSWGRHQPLKRGFCFGADDFAVIPSSSSSLSRSSGSIVWRGFQATYPAEVPEEMILAARRTLQRMRVFRGMLSSNDILQWDKATCDFAQRQYERGKEYWSISAPVGIYNAGNICYIVSTLKSIFEIGCTYFVCSLSPLHVLSSTELCDSMHF